MNRRGYDMQVRIASATEEALALCVANSVWLGRKKLPRNWERGQALLVRVDGAISALGRVRGEGSLQPGRFRLGEYPLVVPVDWLWVASRVGSRVTFGEWGKSLLREAWGTHFGFKILNQAVLPPAQGQKLLVSFGERCKRTGVLEVEAAIRELRQKSDADERT